MYIADNILNNGFMCYEITKQDIFLKMKFKQGNYSPYLSGTVLFSTT